MWHKAYMIKYAHVVAWFCFFCSCEHVCITRICGFRWYIHPYMMTSSNGNIFRVTGHLCGEFTGLRWIPRTKASDAELWCFLWSAPDKRLSKQSWGWWLETLSCSLWRHRNVLQCCFTVTLPIVWVFQCYLRNPEWYSKIDLYHSKNKAQ